MRRLVALLATLALTSVAAGVPVATAATAAPRSRDVSTKSAGAAAPSATVIAVRSDGVGPVPGQPWILCIDDVMASADWVDGAQVPLQLPIGPHVAALGPATSFAACVPSVPVASLAFDVVADQQVLLYTVHVASPGTTFVGLASTMIATCTTTTGTQLISALVDVSTFGFSPTYNVLVDDSVVASGDGLSGAATAPVTPGTHSVTVTRFAPPTLVTFGPISLPLATGDTAVLFYPLMRTIVFPCPEANQVATSTTTTTPELPPTTTSPAAADPASTAPALVAASPSFTG